MVSQGTWNTLFSWITGKQCLIPEGCPPPVEGVFVYGLLLVAIAGSAYYVHRNGVPEWRELL